MVAPPPRRRRGLAQRNGLHAGWFVNSPRKTTPAFLHCNLKINLQQPTTTLLTYLSVSFLGPPPRSLESNPQLPKACQPPCTCPGNPRPRPNQPLGRLSLIPAPRHQLNLPSPRSEAQHRSPRDARLPTRSCPSLRPSPILTARRPSHCRLVRSPPTASCASTALPKLRCTAH